MVGVLMLLMPHGQQEHLPRDHWGTLVKCKAPHLQCSWEARDAGTNGCSLSALS